MAIAVPLLSSPTRVAIYVRISQDRDGEGQGVGRQEDDCRALCERLGWSVGDVYVDNDVSAYSGRRRPAYGRMLDDLRAGLRDAVVVWHPDRLHRSPRELEDFIDLLHASGARVATCTAGDYDLSTEDGQLSARIVGAVARKESADKSRRLRRKHLELAESGKISGGGRRPFGYEKDRVTVRESEADLIRDAADRILAGATLRSIVTDWKARGVTSVTGAAWSSTTLKRLLMSGRISGQREHHGELVADAVWPAIISPDETVQLRALLRDPARDRRGVTPRKYLLTGLVVCGRCRVAMTTRASHVRRTSPAGKSYAYRYQRYICSSDKGGCGRCGIKAEPLEELIVETVLRAYETPKVKRSIERRRTTTAKAAPADKLAELDGRQQKIMAMHAAGEISENEWRAARTALVDQRAKLEGAVVELTKAAQDLPDVVTLRTKWESRDRSSVDQRLLAEMRAAIERLVERIEIAPTTRGNNKFDGDRVTVAWRG